MRKLPIFMSLCAASVVAALFALPVASGGPSKLGDANCDGSVNSIDAALVLQLHADLIEEVCGEVDVNGDGEVNSIDALFLLYEVFVWWPPFPQPAPPEPSNLGDANCDGAVNSIDAALVLQLHAGLIDDVCGDADVNGDFVADSQDAAIILQIEAGLCCPALSAELVTSSLSLLPMAVPYGEQLIMVLNITNTGEQPVTRRYSSGQLYDFVVRDAGGEEVWRWSHGMAFTEAIEHQVFEPGETVFYRVEWNQLDNAGEQVAPGSYTIGAVDVGCSLLPPHSCDLGDSTEIEILPPPDPAACTGDGLEAGLTVNGGGKSFPVGEPIVLGFTVTNCDAEPITRTYMDSQLYDFSVRDEGGEELWRWSRDWGFTPAIVERTYEPGEAVHHWEVWSQDTNAGQDVGPGTYAVIGYDAVCRHAPLDECDLIASQTIEILP